MRDPAFAVRLALAMQEFYEDEGEGFSGARLYRCRMCKKGWQVGGFAMSSGPRHHGGCPVAKLAAVLAETPEDAPVESLAGRRPEEAMSERKVDLWSFIDGIRRDVRATVDTIAATYEGDKREQALVAAASLVAQVAEAGLDQLAAVLAQQPRSLEASDEGDRSIMKKQPFRTGSGNGVAERPARGSGYRSGAAEGPPHWRGRCPATDYRPIGMLGIFSTRIRYRMTAIRAMTMIAVLKGSGIGI